MHKEVRPARNSERLLPAENLFGSDPRKAIGQRGTVNIYVDNRATPSVRPHSAATGQRISAALLCCLAIALFVVGQRTVDAADDGTSGSATYRPQPRIVDLQIQPATASYRLALQPDAVPPGTPVVPPANNETLPSPVQTAPLLPPPSNAFGPEQIRLPLLDAGGQAVGTTPHPSPQVSAAV